MGKKEILKAFFDSSIKRDPSNLRIISLLNKNGCNVIQTVMGEDLSFMNKDSSKAISNIYNSKLKDIKEADIFVCDMSSKSPFLFFELFEALKLKKPSLVLYKEASLEDYEINLLNHQYEYLSVQDYNEENIEEKIFQFLKLARKKFPGRRFTVRLSRELGDYVEYLKPKMGCSSKNDVMIKILEDMMFTDQDFKETNNRV